MIILLDAGPLGLISNPTKKQKQEGLDCREWIKTIINKNHLLCIPEIADYEVRRELIRCGSKKGVERLNLFKESQDFTYIPITTEVMLKAAELWANSRNQGKITAGIEALDGDVILAATALTIQEQRKDVLVGIATTNVRHLEWYTFAKHWQDNFWIQ